MLYTADLHTHSHYAKATSPDLNLENMYAWAQVKGIHLLGTGDFTHPAWLNELKEKLVPDGNGFYSLTQSPERSRPSTPLRAIEGISPQQTDTKFCLSAEVSTEYIFNNKQRKIHHLLYTPDFETADKINTRLSKFGDLAADGRPTLALTSHDLLEIILETSPHAYLVPAHAWTPWCSIFGSKFRHDRLEECFLDLASHIFAIETGLSSDPIMNRRCTMLDNITMMSSSDAHSSSKLGREVNVFNTGFSYDELFESVKSKKGFEGTYEFYPEEGKYTYDGHRVCKVCFSPAETRQHKGICPVCKKQLTMGAMYRVDQLADRPDMVTESSGFSYIVSLAEILSEIYGASSASNKIIQKYISVINRFGNEFNILQHTPIEEIHAYNQRLAEGITNMRTGKVIRKAGYDGVYGKISVVQKRMEEQLQLF